MPVWGDDIALARAIAQKAQSLGGRAYFVGGYVRDAAFVEKARSLAKQGKETCTFRYKKDLRFNPRRFAYYLVHMQRYFKKFKTYYSK